MLLKKKNHNYFIDDVEISSRSEEDSSDEEILEKIQIKKTSEEEDSSKQDSSEDDSSEEDSDEKKKIFSTHTDIIKSYLTIEEIII